MSKSNDKLPKRFDVFLNRNLNFNKTTKTKLNEFYIHTLSKNCSIKTIIKFIKDFQKSRNNNYSTNDLQIVNLNNYKTINFCLDQDYYYDCNTCLLCLRIMHNLGSLILHYKLVHLEYQVFHYKKNNTFTDLKEVHILLFHQTDYIFEMSSPIDQKFNFQSSNVIKNKLATCYLEDIDVLRLNLNLNSGEQQTIKYPLSSLKKYSEKKDEIKTSKQPINNKRVFFHSITGEPFDPNDPNYVDSDYDIDDSYIRSKENKDIEDYFDVCDKDKSFFKLWNSFINDNKQDIAIIHLEKLLHKFVRNNYAEIHLQDLKENFFLHIITLYDHSLINKNQIINVIKDLDEFIKKIN